ncbi:MAG: NADH-quinone oxidoreductase subunit NuoE [Alphaproteobacteria bacterium]
MIVQKTAPPEQQPATFEFSAENQEKAKAIIARYPQGRQASAIMPLFDLAQRQHDGWLPTAAMDYVAKMLDVPRMRAYEVATFYSMYNLAPIGKHLIRVCTTTPCELRGSAEVVETCKAALGVGLNETTADGLFTLREAECLGACVNAPVVWIGDDYYEDVDTDSMRKIVEALRAGNTPPPGSQKGRQTSAPIGGPTTLKEQTV